MKKEFHDLFGAKKVLIGMIHLAGRDTSEKIDRALEELSLLEEEGFNGAIVEDYNGSVDDVIATLKQKPKNPKNKFVVGVNILRNSYLSFKLAHDFGGEFIQFDSVQTPDLDLEKYNQLRIKYSNIAVLGGVRFKYIPSTGKSLEEDIYEGVPRCEAIVTTGEGTGIETSIKKLRDFRKIMGNYPLISGAGVNSKNIYETLKIADGIIIGSFLKDYNTQRKIIRENVKKIVQRVKESF